MKILIAGLGNTGKSTLRERLVEFCIKNHTLHKELDCDNDRLWMPLKDEFENDTTYFIEDVDGLTKEPFYPLNFYDKIYYVLPSWLTHLRLWIFRMWAWFKRGTFGFDPDTKVSDGWRGSGIPYDAANIRPMLTELKKAFKWRREKILYDEDKLAASGRPVVIVTPEVSIKKRKIIFYFKDESADWPDIL
jgi:hypothetical protein